jgi:hypothetical protein
LSSSNHKFMYIYQRWCHGILKYCLEKFLVTWFSNCHH